METFIKSYDVKVWIVIKLGDIPIPISKSSDESQSSTTPSLENYTNEQIEMWDKPEVTYEGADKEGETIESMFARLSKIIGELKASGKIYPPIEHIRRVLLSLPPQWHAKVVALESMNLNTLTYDVVAFKAIQEDKGVKKLAEDEIALITRSEMESFKNYRNSRRGRNFGKGNECPEAKKNYTRGNQKNKELSCWSDEDYFENEHEEIGNICFMAIGESSTEEHRKKSKGKWYLNSGCSNNMTGDKNLFKFVIEYKGGNIRFGENSKGMDSNTIY
ncbi:hypothetical protein KY290_010575 [Solanum tuberosum]|uniref:Retrovirus-related Pol polyprotein from transposon TNT 1-94-like beta-barrel domain-containing protein n=1 Tax=Solanum tuberosum TaxID=4113 RepID=A0ABQ7VY48_SOLTU|nr:hypothetical protein KY290_010575 [Solanum tuberosum]